MQIIIVDGFKVLMAIHISGYFIQIFKVFFVVALVFIFQFTFISPWQIKLNYYQKMLTGIFQLANIVVTYYSRSSSFFSFCLIPSLVLLLPNVLAPNLSQDPILVSCNIAKHQCHIFHLLFC